MMKITATLLILSSVLQVKAIPGKFHENVLVSGCSDTVKDSYKEEMLGLDGEVKWYADFNKGKGVEPQPPFVGHISYPDAYEVALGDMANCKSDLEIIRSALKNPPVKQEEPSSSIYPRDDAEVGVANVLVCHVTGFYPAPVSVTWTRNNLNLTDDITDTVPQLNQDGTFYQFSRLKFTPEQGDVYSCTVHHPSLSSPETRWWDVEQDQPSVGPAVFCGVGLTLGLLGVAMGTFFLIKGNECN